MAKLHSVFYNANYNEGSYDGKYKYAWGVKTLDMDKDLQSQILGEDNNAYNFNLTSLNVIGEVHYETEEVNEIEAAKSLYYAANKVMSETGLKNPYSFQQSSHVWLALQKLTGHQNNDK